MTSEPTGGQRAHTFECPGLLEQVRGSGHDLQLIRTPEQRPGSPIQLPDDPILAPDDQQRRGTDLGEAMSSEVWSPGILSGRTDRLRRDLRPLSDALCGQTM